MDEEQLRATIAEGLELIKYSKRSLQEAPERTTQFLIIVAVLADAKRATEEDKAKLSTLSNATYAQAMNRSTAKQVTEKKAEAESNEDYTNMREGLEQCESKISWLRTYIDIFNNAHITYRQFSKE
jgi:uncharacterized protein YpuA (DUF1002 family)